MEKQKYYFIYQTTNKINGKIYVGKHETNNLNDGYLGSGKYLNRAIEKYGIENFERKILFFCESHDELNAKEAEIVNEDFVAREDTYNLKVGGDGGWSFINNAIWSTEKRQKTSKTASTDDVRKRISIGVKNYYKTASKEFVTEYHKRGAATLKRKFANKKLTPSFTGKHHTDEAKRKIGEKTSIAQAGENNSNFNHHWWKDPNDKTKSLSVKEGDPVPEGWIRGHWNSEHLHVEHIEFCKYCGAEKGKCKRPEICKHFQIFPTLINYFKFDSSKIGSESIFEEIEKCRSFISNLYVEKQLSLPQIANFVGYKSAPGHLCRIFDFLKIPRRSQQEAQRLFLSKK